MKRVQRPETDLGYELDVSAELGDEVITSVDVFHEAGIDVSEPVVSGSVLSFDVSTTSQVGPCRIRIRVSSASHQHEASLVVWVVHH